MFSIIMPLDTNRLEQFKKTKRVYDKFSQKKEFLIPSRDRRAVKDYLSTFDLMRDVKLLSYSHEEGFNPSKALNLALRSAKFDHVLVTSPEVLPLTPILAQLKESLGQNVICQVFDEYENGDKSFSLVNHAYRNHSPAMYFLAMFNRADIEAINGWDEEFMRGYAYEDNDFGERWIRAGLPFTIREDIQALHQYHPRPETIPGGLETNRILFEYNNGQGAIRCKNGLITEE